jgi:excisionase family DNA binding protein
MTPVLELLSHWYPRAWKDPVLLLKEELKAIAAPVPEKPLLTSEQAAKFLAISPESLRRLCRRKAITFVVVMPHEYRFDQKDLDEFVASRRNVRKSAMKSGR